MKLSLEWVNNSLGANDHTKWVRVPPQAKSATIGLGWTGTPTGTLAIVVCNHGVEGTAGAAYTPAPTTNPAGAPGSILLDRIFTGASYIGMTFTYASGTGTWTNDSGVAGTTPTIEFKE